MSDLATKITHILLTVGLCSSIARPLYGVVDKCHFSGLSGTSRVGTGTFWPSRRGAATLLKALKRQLPQSDDRGETIKRLIKEHIPENENDTFEEFVEFFSGKRYTQPSDFEAVADASQSYDLSLPAVKRFRDKLKVRAQGNAEASAKVNSIFAEPWGKAHWRFSEDGLFLDKGARDLWNVYQVSKNMGTLKEFLDSNPHLKFSADSYRDFAVRLIDEVGDNYYADDTINAIINNTQHVPFSPEHVMDIFRVQIPQGRVNRTHFKTRRWGSHGISASDLISDFELGKTPQLNLESNPLLSQETLRITNSSEEPNTAKASSPQADTSIAEMRALSRQVAEQLKELKAFAKAMGLDGEGSLEELGKQMKIFRAMAKAISESEGQQ